MADVKRLQIGRFTYVLRHAPASVALRAGATIANGLAPLVNGYRRGSGGDLSKVMLGVAETLADPALASNIENLCNALSPYTQVIWRDDKGQEFSKTLGGDDGVFEEHFAGRLDALMQWLQAAVEYDLGGFLDAVKAKLSELRARNGAAGTTDSKSESQKAVEKTG